MRDSKADILILTAGFGDGHNSAAKNLAAALNPHCHALCLDPCAVGAPFLNDRLRSFYRNIITHTPWLWRQIYLSTEKQDFSKAHLPMMRKPEKALEEMLHTHQPKAIISTYPLYPYFLDRIFKAGAPRVPVFTVITDSLEINAAWRKAPTDYWLVTDSRTKESLIRQGLPESKLIETGFPVDPHFSNLHPITADDPLSPFKVLYFPTAIKPHVRRAAREILDAHPSVELTIVLGRNVRKLYSRAKEVKNNYPGRVNIKGWTRQVPELLNSHHLVIGKAGGATVHEALAASCPMLVHHLVPGQEEGNLQLLQHLNGGQLADQPGSITSQITEMLADKASTWRKMKRDLTRHSRPNSSHVAAKFILKQAQIND